MKTFTDFINEAKVEVNVDFPSTKEKKDFVAKCEKIATITFGKNKYAETATMIGDKNKIVKFLKSLGYSEEEILIKK